jgi:hypothetical protein
VLRPRQQGKLARGAKDEEHAMIGIDIGKNSFHVVGHDKRVAIRNPKSGARLISQHSPSYPTRPYQPKTSNEAKEPLE